MLVPRGPSITGLFPAGTSSDGTFEIKNVLPGSYFVIANYRNNSNPGPTKLMSGRALVDVGDADVNGVSVPLSPAVDIAGEVIFDGVRDASDARHPIVSLHNELTGNVSGNMSEFFADFSGDRAFVMHDLIDAEYRVSLTDMPAGAYLKSIRFGGTDVANDGLHVEPGSNGRIQIVLGANPGTLDGTVVMRSGDVVANAAVALVPDSAHRQRMDLYKSATTDEFGRFHVPDIAPGSYLVFAWEDIEDGLWRDPEFIRRNEASCKSVQIDERTRATVDLTAVPFSF
jgi:hypothetical protein